MADLVKKLEERDARVRTERDAEWSRFFHLCGTFGPPTEASTLEACREVLGDKLREAKLEGMRHAARLVCSACAEGKKPARVDGLVVFFQHDGKMCRASRILEVLPDVP